MQTIKMTERNDWRLTNQIDYLTGKKLKYSNYKKHSNIWNHDHCEFCFEKLSNECQNGYCTIDSRHWICKRCFEDFKSMFGWVII